MRGGLLLVVLAACSSAPSKPVEPLSGKSERPGLPIRGTYDADSLPSSLVVVNKHLVWVDSIGILYTMPLDRSGPPRKHTEPADHGTKRALVALGSDEVIAGGRQDLVRARIPDGPFKPFGITGATEILTDLAVDERFVYYVMFQDDVIWRVPLTGGTPTKFLTNSKRPNIALHRGTLYSAGLDGVLLAIPTAGGAPTTIADKTGQRSTMAIDDRHLFLANDHPEGGYEKLPETIDRFDMATKARTTIASFYSIDELHLEDEWLYAVVSVKAPDPVGQIVRMARDGSKQQVLLDKIATYGTFAFDSEALYATSDGEIIRVARSTF